VIDDETLEAVREIASSDPYSTRSSGFGLYVLLLLLSRRLFCLYGLTLSLSSLQVEGKLASPTSLLLWRSVRRVRRYRPSWPFHKVKKALFSFMDFLSSELTHIVNDWVATDSCLDLKKAVLLRGISFTSFEVFHLLALFLFAFLLVLIL
jgi:hypothetical protein